MHPSPVALITGGARGIGAEITRALAARGDSCVINYHSSQDQAAALVEEIQTQGGRAIAVQADVGSSDDRQRLVEATISEFGRIELLVNNAGITSPGRLDLLEASEENWDLVFDTNLKGPFFLGQLVAREMIALVDAGSIDTATLINISSISAFAGSANRADYCIAKSAMQMMTWLQADRLAEHAIRVYEVCPGIIESDMTAPVKEKYDRLIEDGLSPIRRWGQPEDIARVILALTDNQFSFTTGERIHVDGGFHIRRL